MATTEKSVPDDLDHVVDAIEQFAEKHGYTPYLSQLEKKGVTSRSKFNKASPVDYVDILEEIDRKPAHCEIDHEELVKEAKISAALSEGTPSWNSFVEQSEYPQFVWQKHFRSYADLLFQTDNEPPLQEYNDEEYGQGWHEVTREWVRYRDSRRCQNCGITEREHKMAFSGIGLNIHHKRKAKQNENAAERNTPDNLITLCTTCHGKVEAGKCEI